MATANVRFKGHPVRLVPLAERSVEATFGVDPASGPDRTALTFLVPGEGVQEIRDIADAERLFGKGSELVEGGLGFPGLRAYMKATEGQKATAYAVGDGRATCCGVENGQHHREDCPRMVEYWSTRCGARAARGQKLTIDVESFRLATGEERCENDKACEGRHSCGSGQVLFWENVPEFADCLVCRARVMPYGEFGCLGFGVWDEETQQTRGGPVCATCSKMSPMDLEWRGGRLVRKDAGPTLRIYDAAGCVLAEGPMRVERTEKGARLHYSSGLYIMITMDVNDASEEQLRALGLGPREDVINLRDFIGVPAEPMRSRIVFNGEEDDAIVSLATLDDDGTFSCACGSTDPATHADGCKLPWQCRAAAQAGYEAAPGKASEAVHRALLGAGAVALFGWIRQFWAASPAGQLSARDAAVARVIADVPEGCDGERWANVVRVIAALGAECGAPMQEQIGWLGHRTRIFAPLVAAYAAERRAGYSREQAALRATAKLGGAANASWLFAAYEAGR